MVISPHADDAAAFCGGTLAKFAAEGWRLVFVRVTDDAKDSVGLTVEETLARNAAELHDAARALGAAEVVELGFETDTLGDVSRVALRERFVHLLRKHRPYAVFSFDPFGLYEGNLDHVVTAQAVEEAYWVACFDLHHPEHFAEGLAPFAVCERWYFARRLPESNHVEDITAHFGAKLDALAAHRTMIRNVIQLTRLQLETFGHRAEALDQAQDADPRPLMEMVFGQQGQAVAAAAGLPEGRLAEVFRLVRFGDLEPLVGAIAEPIPGAPPPPRRPSLDPEA
jgi:LmbE family N-acetylglucosaminyl deacetylase